MTFRLLNLWLYLSLNPPSYHNLVTLYAYILLVKFLFIDLFIYRYIYDMNYLCYDHLWSLAIYGCRVCVIAYLSAKRAVNGGPGYYAASWQIEKGCG